MNILLFSDWVSVWCVAFFVDFGHIEIPRNLNVPPSLRMLGIEPQVLIFTTLHIIIQRFTKLILIQGNYSTRSNVFSDEIELRDSRRCQGVRSSLGDCWEEYRHATSSQVYHDIVIVKMTWLIFQVLSNNSSPMSLSQFQARRRRVHGLWIIRR